MADSVMKVKVIEQSQISPPQHSTPPRTSLPLTFFDILWLAFSPVKRLMFFEFRHCNQHFIETVLPNIKHSLSLALQHFYPLAGRLITTPSTDDHEIAYSDGDSVSLTVAEADFDFEYLTSRRPRDISEYVSLVPELISKLELQDMTPLMAVQVTLFPNSGITVGITVSHAVADGKITTHFIKHWASICKLQGKNHSDILLPFFDRSVIKDPNGLCAKFREQLRDFIESFKTFKVANSLAPTDKVQATFVLGAPEIEKLKQYVRNKLHDHDYTFHVSTFVVACAYVWVCFIKCYIDEKNHEKAYFVFNADCRERLDPPIPKFYFGNCLMSCVTQANKCDLIGEEGVVVAAEVLGRGVERMNKEGVLGGVDTMIPYMSNIIRSGAKVMSVAGSPKFKLYETDFGWGRPKKVDVVSLENSGAICVSESRDGENGGGIEVGLVLSWLEMDAFASHFADTLNKIGP
ncbi:hypothetical protein Sjap_016633 [Stephania japonica]|uniref:Uncharacterized protein n=1 Tax=Stephania japonica TaxID=461633 RepID=A0AAP0NV60_9MAGN